MINIFMKLHYKYYLIAAFFGLIVFFNSSIPVSAATALMRDTGLLKGPFPCSMNDAFTYKNYLYAACIESGFQIFDISDPFSPKWAGKTDIGETRTFTGKIYPGTVGKAVVSGNYAYVSLINQGGLYIVDVSDPTSPEAVSAYPNDEKDMSYYGDESDIVHYSIEKIFIHKNYLYVVGGPSSIEHPLDKNGVASTVLVERRGVQILDISDPASPVLVGEYMLSKKSSPYDAFIEDQIMYVLFRDSNGTWIHSVDVANPATPSFISQYKLNQNGLYNGRSDKPTFSAYNQYAYVADWTNQIKILDFTNAKKMKLTAVYAMPGEISRIFISKKYAYVEYYISNLLEGFYIFDISRPTSPVLIGKYDSSWRNCAASGDYVYQSNKILQLDVNPNTGKDQKIADIVKGKILLQTESKGEAWYLNPSDGKRYFLGKPKDMLAVMRSRGIGIANANLAKIPQSGSSAVGDMALRKRLAGKILLQVESKGEAWYVNPKNFKRYSLGRPTDAFQIIKKMGIGISNSNLSKILISAKSEIPH